MYGRRKQFGGQQYLMELGTIISTYARTCGSFTKEQAYLMIPEKHYSTVDKVLRGMVTQKNIFLKGDRYYVANPLAKPDHKMIDCLWVLLDLNRDEEPNSDNFWFSDSERPAYISFVKNKTMYDIVPFNEGEDSTTVYLDNKYAKEKQKSKEINHKYIIVVPNERVMSTLPIMNAPHMCAVLTDLKNEEMNYETKKVIDIQYFGED